MTHHNSSEGPDFADVLALRSKFGVEALLRQRFDNNAEAVLELKQTMLAHADRGQCFYELTLAKLEHDADNSDADVDHPVTLETFQNDTAFSQASQYLCSVVLRSRKLRVSRGTGLSFRLEWSQIADDQPEFLLQQKKQSSTSPAQSTERCAQQLQRQQPVNLATLGWMTTDADDDTSTINQKTRRKESISGDPFHSRWSQETPDPKHRYSQGANERKNRAQLHKDAVHYF